MPFGPVNPDIVKAYTNDPRTLIAQSLMQNGGSTAPVAAGKYGIPDGIARALQGIAGAYMQKQNAKQYKGEETAHNAQLAKIMAGSAPPDAQLASATALQSPGLPPPAMGAATPPPAPAMPPPMATEALPPSNATQQPGTGGGLPMPPPPAPMAPPPAAMAPPAPPPPAMGAMGGIPGAAPSVAPQPARMGSDQLSNIARALNPNAQITSGVRTAVHNAAVGGVPNSQHVRGTAIDGIFPGMNAGQVRSGFNKAGAQVDVIDEGDHFHIQGARHPTMGAPAPVQRNAISGGPSIPPTPPAPRTPDPDMPAMPTAPTDTGAPVKSERLRIARALLNSGDPYSTNTAMDYMDKGLTEQNNSDEAAAGRKGDITKMGYGGALGNYYGAQSDKRQNAYGNQKMEKQFAQDDAMFEKDSGLKLSMQDKSFAHDMTKAGYDRETAYGLAQLNNNADFKKQQMIIDAAKGTAEEKAAAKRTMFLSTPTGAKIWDATGQRIQQNEQTINDLQSFMDMNSKQTTGGPVLGSGIGAGFVKQFNNNLQQMDSITQKLAPMMRQAGQGSMSDKDLAGFKQSVPNIGSTAVTNKRTGARLVNGFRRVNDYEQHKIESMADGTQNNFVHEWEMFRQSVSIDSGKSFEQWKASIPTVK